MMELSEQNVVGYLRERGRASAGEVLVKALSGGVANVVLQVFDLEGGREVGKDLQTQALSHEGACFVLKQPLPKFRTAADWRVDIDRVLVERDCMQLLGELLPAGSVPQVLWYDQENHILAISCAPTGSVIWKKALLEGEVLMDAATHAGMLLGMMHSATEGDPAVRARYGDPTFFVQQRTDPYLLATAEKHPEVAPRLRQMAELLLAGGRCLIHGDYSPKNMFLVPHAGRLAEELKRDPQQKGTFALSHLLLLDFEVAFYGHPAFDVATLVNHLLLKGFYHGKRWRPFMLMADNFWETYRTTAEPGLARAAGAVAGHLLGTLLLARIDGKSPVEYLAGDPALQERVRAAARDILSARDGSLEEALDRVSGYFEPAS